MKAIYVVIIEGIVSETVFTGISAIAREHKISRTTLSTHINQFGKHEGKRIQVYKCRIVKGRQKGQRLK